MYCTTKLSFKNFKKRSTAHNCSQAENLELAFIYEVIDKKRVDSCVKNKLKPWLTRDDREIYKINLDEIKKIIIDCNDTITFYSENNKTIKTDESDESIDKQIKRLESQDADYYLIISSSDNIDEVKSIIEDEYKKYKNKYIEFKKKCESKQNID